MTKQETGRRRDAQGRTLALALATAAAIGCASERPSATPLGVRAPPQPPPAACDSATLAEPYGQDMFGILTRVKADSVAAKCVFDSVGRRRPTTARERFDQLMAQAAPYDSMRHKLLGIQPGALRMFKPDQRQLLDRALIENDDALREKAASVVSKVRAAWVTRCNQELDAVRRVLDALYQQALRAAEDPAAGTGARDRVSAALRSVETDGAVCSTPTGEFPNVEPFDSSKPQVTVSLPEAEHSVAALGEGLRVYISPDQVFVGRDRVVDLDRAATGPAGSTDPRALLLDPLAAALRSQTGRQTQEVLLFADRSARYGAVVRTWLTLVDGGFDRVLLVVRSDPGAPPKGFAVHGPPSEGDVVLALGTTKTAAFVEGTPLGTDCQTGGPETNFQASGKPDFGLLQSCLERARVSSKRENWAGRVVADPDVEWSTVIGAVDALVGSGIGVVSMDLAGRGSGSDAHRSARL